jgi:hypothetical protein
MKTIGQFEFPETREEAETWEPRFGYRALHRNVLAVMKTREEGTWKCYIVPVPGQNHDREMMELWRTEGAQADEALARALFPYMNDIPYAR